MLPRSRWSCLRFVSGAILLGCLPFAMGGCGNDITGCDICWEFDSYPALTHPHNTLQALEIAYSRRDSIKYAELYDSTYTGSSVDLQDPGNSIDFSFSDEARHMGALASTPGLTAYLDLGSPEMWHLLPSDDPVHPEWVIVKITGSAYRIEIFEGTHGLGATGGPSTFQEFAFSPTLDSTSPTDTLWRIVRWREVGNSEPDPTP